MGRVRRYCSGVAGRAAIVAILVAIGIGCSLAEEAAVGVALRAMMGEAKNTVDSISVESLHDKMLTGDDILVLDIRTEAEFKAGHLRGAVWSPRGKIEFAAAGGSIPTDRGQIVVYCKRHGRSALCAVTLTQLGFEDVAYLTGGFEAWAKAGYSVFNQHGELTIKSFEKGEEE